MDYKQSYFYVSRMDSDVICASTGMSANIKVGDLYRGISVFNEETGDYHCSILIKDIENEDGSLVPMSLLFFIDTDNNIKVSHDIFEVDLKDLSGLEDVSSESYLKAAEWIKSPKDDIKFLKDLIRKDYIPRILSTSIPMKGISRYNFLSQFLGMDSIDDSEFETISQTTTPDETPSMKSRVFKEINNIENEASLEALLKLALTLNR